MAGWLLQGDLTGAGVGLDMPNPAFDPYEGQVLQRIAYLLGQSNVINLTVVNSGGNLGSITDTRMQAGASTSTTAAQGGFATSAIHLTYHQSLAVHTLGLIKHIVHLHQYLLILTYIGIQ